MSPSPTSSGTRRAPGRRDPCHGRRASAHLLDVTDDALTQAVVDAVVAETGRIDIAFVTPASAKSCRPKNCR